ncbi:OmpA family protein [Pantoea sp. LS15]|uniref:type IVB secretion system protein IcmH/DotU n=1 Tax=Enterobacterales TaxID=91347 RepID=UPI000E0EF7C9|nr:MULTISPECIES: type IVB secretion system protein IcmH/DotU [Enterobacterales]NJQ21805.1 OmpA family protein [Pantoea sp. LS15]NKF48401.1 OmpA family protein [Pantoea sp. LS15]RDK12959.1 hypothetical protein CEJ32_19995 [Enterobacter sp. 9-2]
MRWMSRLWRRREPSALPSLPHLTEEFFHETARLRTLRQAPDVEALRAALIVRFETVAQRVRDAGIVKADWDRARYALCTLLDETICDTPWGGGVWARKSLLLHFYGENLGGERFFSLLTKLEEEESRHRAGLAEVFYLCLALGLEGKYRLRDEGLAQLTTIRRRLYQQITVLSPLTPCKAPALRWHHAWGWGTGLGLMMLSAALAGGGSLLSEYEQQQRRLDNALASVGAQDWIQGLSVALAAEIRSGALQLDAEDNGVRLLLSGGAFFASGHADLSARQRLVLQRLADRVRHLPVRLRIVGHSDNVAAGSRWPDNESLSLARALAVMDAMNLPTASPSFSVSAEGRGDKDPLVANDSADNRARNRRVEIYITPFESSSA